MQRYLSIVLDNLCTINKTLIEDESYKLDDYISKTFNDSKEVRNKFNKIIQPFLEEHYKLINYVEQKNNKRYQGQIVILEVLDDGSFKRVKVLYKTDIKIIKNEYLKNQDLIRNFIINNRYFFPRYINDKIKRNLSKTDYEYMISEWYRGIKTEPNYFEICRSILKFADSYLKLEKQKTKELNINLSSDFNNFQFLNNDESDIDYDPDFDYHPDLDEIEKMKYHDEIDDLFDTNLNFEDDEEIINKKVKKKKLELPGQISFFD